jgi:hypothetical protein
MKGKGEKHGPTNRAERSVIARLRRQQCSHVRATSLATVDVRRGKRQDVLLMALCERCAKKVRLAMIEQVQSKAK